MRRQTRITKFIAYTPQPVALHLDDYELDIESDCEISSEESHCKSFTNVDNREFHAPDDLVTYWEQQGMLFRHRESSYLSRRNPRSRCDKFGRIAYVGHMPADLKKFVVNRGLQDPYPDGVTLKYHYIRLLAKADREWTFRLMDLPPEMRILIYRGLLLFPPSSSPFISYNAAGYKAYPAILRACSEIHEEARHVLYDHNDFVTAYSASILSTGEGGVTFARVHKKAAYSHCSHATFLHLPHAINYYPDFLRRIASLSVHVKLTTHAHSNTIPQDEAMMPLNHFLYGLASFLMDGHRLKKLRLCLDIDSRVDDSRYGMMLYPLRRLRNIQQVTIEGRIPDNVKVRLVYDMESNEPTFNTMRQWQLISDEAEAQLGINNAIHGSEECNCGECSVSERIEAILSQMSCLSSSGKYSSSSSRQEEQFIARLAKVREFLDRTRLNGLEKLLKDLQDNRAAQKQYNAVTDDGRLDEAAKIWAGKLFNHDVEYDPDEDWVDEEVNEGDEIKKTTAASMSPCHYNSVEL